jgi:hypothetical protein
MVSFVSSVREKQRSATMSRSIADQWALLLAVCQEAATTKAGQMRAIWFRLGKRVVRINNVSPISGIFRGHGIPGWRQQQLLAYWQNGNTK